MSYWLFLILFLGLPIAILAAANRLAFPGRLAVLLLALSGLAVLYTGPWDNLLVAEHVWSYRMSLVSGVRIGLVPIEEYSFYVLQVVATGLWLLWLRRRIRSS